jgi:aspartate/methionine/tyrosine aminotransferase
VLGLPALREAIAQRMTTQWRIDMSGQEVMVTAGANQAALNVALALLDVSDKVQQTFNVIAFAHRTHTSRRQWQP